MSNWAVLARVVCVTALTTSMAAAHSASDAYLTLSADAVDKKPTSTFHGQWDIALRDLDFVLNLDDNGDGEITWGELKHHQSEIQHYAYRQLEFADSTLAACTIKPLRLLIDAHADGSYAALFFDVVCAHGMGPVEMKYRLFFSIDPSHRGIFVLHAGEDTSTAVLSPQNQDITLNRAR